MSTIQNLKNFIRHGKQARQNNSPHAEPTTNVSNVHASPQRHNNYAPPPNQHAGITEPNIHEHHKPPPVAAAAGFTTAPGAQQQNNVARADNIAGKAAADHQKLHQQGGATSKDADPSVLERMVAEERESKGKLPNYPGLERWVLIEKMGDGAFSNVYRARDTKGQYQEVAIKVVRKFEMSSSQVSTFDSYPVRLAQQKHTTLESSHLTLLPLYKFYEDQQPTLCEF